MAWQLNSFWLVPTELSIRHDEQTREDLDYVGNDYRHFVSFVAFRIGGWSDIRRHSACAAVSRGRSFYYSTSYGTRSRITLRERESFC